MFQWDYHISKYFICSTYLFLSFFQTSAHSQSGHTSLSSPPEKRVRSATPGNTTRVPLPTAPLFNPDPERIHPHTKVTAPKKGGPKETTVVFETVAAPADVLRSAQAPKSGSGLTQSKADVPPGDTLHARASVAPSVLEDIVERQRVVDHLQQLADEAKRQSQMIEPLPIEPEVEQMPKVKRPIDNTKKQHFKRPPIYDGTLGVSSRRRMMVTK